MEAIKSNRDLRLEQCRCIWNRLDFGNLMCAKYNYSQINFWGFDVENWNFSNKAQNLEALKITNLTAIQQKRRLKMRSWNSKLLCCDSYCVPNRGSLSSNQRIFCTELKRRRSILLKIIWKCLSRIVCIVHLQYKTKIKNQFLISILYFKQPKKWYCGTMAFQSLFFVFKSYHFMMTFMKYKYEKYQ